MEPQQKISKQSYSNGTLTTSTQNTWVFNNDVYFNKNCSSGIQYIVLVRSKK